MFGLKRAKEVIIFTGSNGGYGNLGDEWLYEAAKARYSKDVTKKYQVVIVMANPPKRQRDGFTYIQDTPEALEKAGVSIEKIKAVHYYGGGYLNSYWMKDKIWLYDLLVEKGVPKDKFFFTCAGLGPLEDEDFDRLRAIAGTAGVFGVRDQYFSKEIDATFMFDESIHVIDFTPRSKPLTDLLVNFRIAKHVGGEESDFKTLLQSLAAFAKQRGLQLRFFPMVEGIGFSEGAEMRRILAECGIEAVVQDRPASYKALMSMYDSAALVVTTSYHATLASLYTGTPVVALYGNEYYNFKFKGLSDVVDSPLIVPFKLGDELNDVWERAIKVTDDSMPGKIAELKKLNDKGYEALEEILHAS